MARFSSHFPRIGFDRCRTPDWRFFRELAPTGSPRPRLPRGTHPSASRPRRRTRPEPTAHHGVRTERCRAKEAPGHQEDGSGELQVLRRRAARRPLPQGAPCRGRGRRGRRRGRRRGARRPAPRDSETHRNGDTGPRYHPRRPDAGLRARSPRPALRHAPRRRSPAPDLVFFLASAFPVPSSPSLPRSLRSLSPPWLVLTVAASPMSSTRCFSCSASAPSSSA